MLGSAAAGARNAVPAVVHVGWDLKWGRDSDSNDGRFRPAVRSATIEQMIYPRPSDQSYTQSPLSPDRQLLGGRGFHAANATRRRIPAL